MICENIFLIAKNIKEKLDGDSPFPNELFKQCERHDFKMLSYDQVLGYHPSEGIKLKKIYIHPIDHPSYPHFCYPVFEVEYTKWLTATSDLTKIKSTINKVYSQFKQVEQDGKIILHNDVKPELCVCPKQDYNWFYGCKISACEFTEENPLCLYRPRCRGCNYMFSYKFIQKHLVDTPNCYEKYSQEAYDKLNELCDQLRTKEADENLEKRKASEQSYFLAIKRDWDGWNKWFKEHNKSKEDLKGTGRREFLWVKDQWKKLQKQVKTDETDDNVDDDNEIDDDVDDNVDDDDGVKKVLHMFDSGGVKHVQHI